MRIAIHAFDDMTRFHRAAPLLVFETAAELGLAPEWVTTVWASGCSSVRAVERLVLDDLAGREAAETADLLVFPTWPAELPAPDVDLIELVQRAHRLGARIAGLCLGAFPVCGSGVLDGRAAVTHWGSADALAAQYPAVDVGGSALYLDHGDVLTSAGTASAIDACLHLVRSELGRLRPVWWCSCAIRFSGSGCCG